MKPRLAEGWPVPVPRFSRHPAIPGTRAGQQNPRCRAMGYLDEHARKDAPKACPRRDKPARPGAVGALLGSVRMILDLCLLHFRKLELFVEVVRFSRAFILGLAICRCSIVLN